MSSEPANPAEMGIPQLDWPGVRDDERSRWLALSGAEKQRARMRLEALRRFETDRPPTIVAAAKAAGMVPSAFHAMKRRWSENPSIDSLGLKPKASPGRASRKGVEFKTSVIAAIKRHMGEQPPPSTTEIQRLVDEEFPGRVSPATFYSWLREARLSTSAGRTIGKVMSIDVCPIDLMDPEGSPYGGVFVVDVGARLILGAGLISAKMPDNGYPMARVDALRRLKDLPLGLFPLASRLQSLDVQLLGGLSGNFSAKGHSDNEWRFLGTFSFVRIAIPPETKFAPGRAISLAAGDWLGGLRLSSPRRHDARQDENSKRLAMTFEEAEEALSSAMDRYVMTTCQTLGAPDANRDKAARERLLRILKPVRSTKLVADVAVPRAR